MILLLILYNLDLQKAFDKVPYDILIKKVSDIGVEVDVIRWIDNWLSDREQRVIVNGEVSDWGRVESGVPQGSVLGPLLFSIFINDLDEGLLNKIIKFADDTKIWGRVDSLEEADSMQKDLETLESWTKNNGMSLIGLSCLLVSS